MSSRRLPNLIVSTPLLASTFVAGALVLGEGVAWAQDPAPATAQPAPAATPPPTAAAPAAPTAAAPAPKEDPDDRPADDPFRSIGLTANPLSLILLRIGLNIDYLPAPHHAITVNPFGQFISVGDKGSIGGETSYTNIGGELGYRFYTGRRGANGFFVGPFFTLMNSSASTSVTLAGKTTESSASLLSYGGGVDLGGQHVFKSGFTIGGGAGVMYLKSSATAANTSTTVKFDGALPRFLFTIGYSF